jgi:hypothetical protein
MLGAAVALHIAMLVSLRTEWLNPLFNDTRNRPGPAADFYSVYHSGRQVLTGRSPYDHDESPRITPAYFAPFRYPPGVAYTLGAAFGGTLEPRAAYVVWIALLELLLLANLWGVRFLVDDERLRTYVRCGWLVFTPLYVELWMGQFTLFAVSLVYWAVIGWERGRARLAAAAWSVASAIKLFPLALGALLLRRRQWYALAAAAGVLALALAWFIGRPDDFSGFLQLNFSRPQIAEVHAGNLGLHAFVYELFAWGGHLDGASWAPYSRAISIAFAAVAAYAMLRPRAPDDRDDRIRAAMALWLLPLISKDAWEHHYVVALPALTLMVAAWRDRPRRLVATAVIFAVIALPTWLVLVQDVPSTWYPSATWSPLATALYHAPKPLAATAGFALCGWTLLGRRRV